MTIRTLDVCPDIPHRIHQAAAEILACYHTEREALRDHRLAKLQTFPECDRAAVRDVVNRVIQARTVHP